MGEFTGPTDRTIRRILAESRTAGRRIERAHPAAEGLRVRANAATHAVSWVWYGPRAEDGKRPLHVLGSWPAVSAKEAAKRLEDLRMDAQRRASGFSGPARDVRNGMTLRQLLALFYWRKLRRRRNRWSPVNVVRHHVLDVLGWSTQVRAVRPLDVERVIEKLTDAGYGNQAAKTLALVKQMFRVAVRAHVIEQSPAADLSRSDFDIYTPRRNRRLSAEELGALWRVLNDNTPPANGALARRETARLGLIVLLATGRRTGELIKARKDHFDLDSAAWNVPPEVRKLTREAEARKGNDLVHLPPQAVAALRRLFALAPSSPWVLASPLDSKSGHVEDATLARAFRNLQCNGVLKLAEPATPHDYRRALRSTVVERRWCSVVAAELLLGHEIGGIAGTYDVGTYDDERAAALERWTAYLDALAGFGDAKVANLDAAREVTGA